MKSLYLLPLLLLPLHAYSAAYKCEQPDGSIEFSDRPCSENDKTMKTFGDTPDLSADSLAPEKQSDASTENKEIDSENQPINADALQKCKEDLLKNKGYKAFVEVERISEYMANGDYYLKANLSVINSLGDIALIGYECIVHKNGKVAGIPRLEPYKIEPTSEASATAYPERRMPYGGAVCPSVDMWKNYRDAVLAGNPMKDLHKECHRLDRDQRVYGPIDTKEYRGIEFWKVSLPNGDRVWVEKVNIRE